jgi:G2/mitotic-specific cyclin-B, other
MKDVTGTSSRHHSRNNACYQKKRSSLVGGGVSKSHKSSSRRDSVKSSDGLKTYLSAQQQREALILSLHRQGILLEDEYSDEVKQYMLNMEVSISYHHNSLF